ncbi:MAG: MoaD/ThiS family protein [Candidatus Bathyarchaeia archaeon]
MRVRVKYYAGLRERVGKSIEVLDLNAEPMVKDLRSEVAMRYSLDEDILLVALNGSFANPDTVIDEGDEIAVFPPVSGG